MKLYPTNTNITYTAVASTAGMPSDTFSYTWSFSDGSAHASGASVAKAWASIGSPIATVTAVDTLTNGSASVAKQISVADPNAAWLATAMSAYVIGDYLYRFKQTTSMVQRMNLKTAAGVRFTWVDYAKFTVGPNDQVYLYIAGNNIYIGLVPAGSFGKASSLYQIVGTDTVNNTNAVLVSGLILTAQSPTAYDCADGPVAGQVGTGTLVDLYVNGSLSVAATSSNNSTVNLADSLTLGNRDQGTKTSFNNIYPVEHRVRPNNSILPIQFSSSISKTWTPKYLWDVSAVPTNKHQYVDEISGSWTFTTPFGTVSDSSTVSELTLVAGSSFTYTQSASGYEPQLDVSVPNKVRHTGGGYSVYLSSYVLGGTNPIYMQYVNRYSDIIVPMYAVSFTTTNSLASPLLQYPSRGVYGVGTPAPTSFFRVGLSDGTYYDDYTSTTFPASMYGMIVDSSHNYYQILYSPGPSYTIGKAGGTFYPLTMPPCAYVDGAGNIYTMNQANDGSGIYFAISKNGTLVQNIYDGVTLYVSPGDLIY
jgi:hypothetical protein